MDAGTHQLVEEARGGDAAAYDRLFQRVGHRLLGYVSLRLGARLRGRLDPQDVVQEVLLAAHRGFGAFVPRGPNAFNRWLFTIADHRLRDLADYHAAQRRDDRREDELVTSRDPREGPATKAGSAEARARLFQALELLEGPQREVLVLHYFQGLSPDELGAALGCTGRHARRLLAGAQSALATRLGGVAAPGGAGDEAVVSRAMAALDLGAGLERVGPYELRGVLGHGGLSTVYRAYHPALDREVALKLLRTDEGPARRRLLEREVGALTRLAHPGIVRVQEVGEHDGAAYLVMDLLPGASLQSILADEGPLEVVAAVRIAWHLALALDHAHREGVLHRDVKPANVILGPDGAPVLTDFGLATFLDGGAKLLTDRGQRLGTVGFWPPEQASGLAFTPGPAADIYALGATLFAMLTGQPPFQRATLNDQVLATLTEPAPPPSRLRPEVDPLLDQITLCCLEKDPARRFPSAQGLALALSCWVPPG